ncbi:hypothetical protein C5Y96_17590 [Blastopirellula marina]|uniref:Protein-glutamine gamma-glutamyltransferase-like C-terminal domain-containing protein n=1 Tax=Blastopirellula marina TaxID=124 RepID=A0A2S8F5B2_9BACT|nr:MULTISPECIES: DUF4129 domain-containing protein [Pirellulaceae]PQO27355.1 hypothetical protein C5Y96_17590 [Blastopirellula marina]RCS47892.1 DUF4129 domain-containing protein [Bremerella cremea]
MRPRLTELDYAIIAVAPALIMVLVGSLVLFSVGIFYDGPHVWRLNFIMCMFVLGIVANARVGIEEGGTRAAILGGILGVCVLAAVMRFVPEAIILTAVLLAVVWWLSTRLVYDCTVMAGSVDASQKGLMQWIRGEVPEEESHEQEITQPDDQLQGVTGQAEEDTQQSKTFLEKLDAWINPTNTKFAPGAWVVYFSLAALPIFGFGQALAGSKVADKKWYLFTLLVAYVFAALSLLVTTSFLGLRRYLQTRGLVMPLSMTGTWLGVGFGVVALVLIVVSILPRPNAEYELAQLPFYQDEQQRKASQVAVNKDGTNDNRQDRSKTTENQERADENSQKSDETRKDGKEASNQSDPNAQKKKPGESKESDQQQSENSKTNDKNQSEGQKESDSQEKSSDPSKSQQGEAEQRQGDQSSEKSDKPEQKQQDDTKPKPSEEKDSQEDASNEPPQDQSNQSPSQTPAFSFPNPLASLGDLLKVLVYVVVLGMIAFLVWKFWDDIVKAWNEFWASLLGEKKKEEVEQGVAPEPLKKPRIAFSAFRNPFQDPSWKGKPLEEWVRYSFAALEAWAAEQGSQRREEQTPGEFATMLENEHHELASTVRPTADLYGQVAYGSGKAPRETLEILRKLWERLKS